MNRLGFKVVLLATLLSAPVQADELLLVVTNNSQLTQLNKAQIRHIYLENGVNYAVKPLNLIAGSRLRAVFNAKVIGLTEARVQSYWVQMRFTGRMKEPIEFSSVEKLLQFLEQPSEQGYIAYLPEETQLPETLKVIDRINY